jgi:hypothetical protein
VFALCLVAIALAKPGGGTPRKIPNLSIRQISATTIEQLVQASAALMFCATLAPLAPLECRMFTRLRNGLRFA